MRGFFAREWLALVVMVAALAIPGSAQADSWGMPAQATYSSANGAYRFTVEPALLGNQLDYFREEAEASESGRKVERPAPIGLLERREGSNWVQVWAKPLVNPVAPVDVLVSDDGKHIVTLDNWHSLGFGENVIVVYGPNGALVNSMALTSLVPETYLAALPRSVSSLEWRDNAVLSPDGTRLELDVRFPSEERESSALPVRFDLVLTDGSVRVANAGRLDEALLEAARIAALQAEADRARISYLTQPLAPPAVPGGDWHGYLLEAFFRLTPDYLDSPIPDVTVLFGPDNGRYRESVGWLTGSLSDLKDFPGSAVIASPQSQDGLIKALGQATHRLKQDALRGSTIYVSVAASHRDEAKRIIAPTGARFVWLDPASTIPQRAERIAGSAAEQAANQERERRRRNELNDELDSLGN